MKRAPFAGVLSILCLLSSGCLPSLQPLIREADAYHEPALVGTWVAGPGDSLRRLPADQPCTEQRWVITRDGEVGYDVRLLDDDGAEEGVFEARVARFSSGTFLDLRADPDDNGAGELLALHLLGASSFYRIEFEGDLLHTAWIDEEWLEKRLESGAVRLPHQRVDGGLILTASTKELQRFVKRHGAKKEAFTNDPSFPFGK